MTEISNFSIGDIVTLKSHPLFKDFLENVFSEQVPPLMLVKDVFFEKKDKKIFSDVLSNTLIADRIKYTCVHFDDKKSAFVESVIYHSFLEKIDGKSSMIFLRKKNKNDKDTKSLFKLLEEIDNEYKNAEYAFGKTVMFKTSKLENRKTIGNNVYSYPSFTSPDFILSGIKMDEASNLFYEGGKTKKQVSEISYKIMWYNYVQQKFSEKYLPKEFFIELLEGKPVIVEKK